MANLNDGMLASFAPQDASSVCYRLDVTAAASTIVLTGGLYSVFVDTSDPVIGGFAGDPTIPTTGSATGTTAWVWGNGVTATLMVAPGGATLSAKVTAATSGTLWLTRVV